MKDNVFKRTIELEDACKELERQMMLESSRIRFIKLKGILDFTRQTLIINRSILNRL